MIGPHATSRQPPGAPSAGASPAQAHAPAAAGAASYNGRLLPVLIAACSLGLLTPLLGPLFTGRVFVYNDLAWFHLPMRHLYQQALHAGDSVLWTPSIFAGLYLHGEGQTGVFHPLHQVLYRFLPLGAAFNLEMIASYVLGFAGAFWLLRRLHFSQAASLFGAMLFAFSGFTLLHHHHVNLVAVVAHLPWLLAAADVLIVSPREGSRAEVLASAAVAAILGSALLLGFPQGVWWNLIALGAFAVFRAGETGRWRRLLPCGAAVALGILLGGIQLLPLADAAAHSRRMELPADFALTFSLHPINLMQFWSPYFLARGAYTTRDYLWFHEFGIYSGAILPIALIWVWMRRHALPERRALITAATVFAAVMLILALGRYGGLAWVVTYLPGLQSLRAPVRYIVLVQFALALLAAVMLDDLLAIARGHRGGPAGRMTALWIPAALGIATTLALNTRVLPFGQQTFAAATDAAPGVAVVVLVSLLVYLSARRVRWALAALLVVTAVDLGLWGIGFISRTPPRTIEDLTAAVQPAPDEPAQAYAFAPERGPYSHNVLVLRGYRLTSGYVGLFPATRHPLDGDTSRRLSGTRWIFTQDGVRLPAQDGVERVRLLDAQGNPAAGRVLLTVDRPGHLVARVDAPGPRILAFTERFHHGWSATVEGAPLTMVPVEGDFLGCLIDPGVQRVDLRFRPRSFIYGAVVSGIGAVWLVGILVLRRR